MIVPATDFQALHLPSPSLLPKGMDRLVYSAIGFQKGRVSVLKKLLTQADTIVETSNHYRHLSNQNLHQRLEEMRMVYRRQMKRQQDQLLEALPLLVEASDRTLGLRPFSRQIAGSLALAKGFLVEMETGEGKSLTACLTAILAGWTEKPCHIITVNDYLAKRDAYELSPLYKFCGLSVSWIDQGMEEKIRRSHYKKNVVYVTSKELLADFLRDRLKIGSCRHPEQRVIQHLLVPRKTHQQSLVLRGLHTAIVDEADSVLIDEAVTPLLITHYQQNIPLRDACITAYTIAKKLFETVDYRVDHTYQEIRLTEEGNRKIDSFLESLPSIWKGQDRREEIILQALIAREFYHRDEQYVVLNDTIIIVDEFTGRLMPNKTWRHGLQQAIEAKETLPLSQPNETVARMSFQKFFRLFPKLSGLTGTASEAKAEFWNIYGLSVMKIPPNKPCLRESLPIRFFKNKKQKWHAIITEITKYNRAGRPVLVGTRSIKASQQLAEKLLGKGLTFNLLNAHEHEKEAAIIAAAGQRGAITIATNMAGRGTDIKLGIGVEKLGGLHVIATEHHQSSRIDRQLFGRCARQGSPGSSVSFLSLDDEIIKSSSSGPFRNIASSALGKNIPGTQAIMKHIVSTNQKSAERKHARQRKNILRTDSWLEEALSFGKTTL